MIERRNFLKSLLGAAAVCAVPFKWVYNKFCGTIYCDSEKGRQNNDGFTSDTPVQSLQQAFDRIPMSKQAVTIRLKGTFYAGEFPREFPPKNAMLHVERGSRLIIDGGKYICLRSRINGTYETSCRGFRRHFITV